MRQRLSDFAYFFVSFDHIIAISRTERTVRIKEEMI